MTTHDIRVLRFPGSSVRVEAPPRDLAWLVQFLSPPFRPQRESEADLHVRMVRDHEAFETLRAAGPDTAGRRRASYYLDTRTETLPMWGNRKGEETVFDEAHSYFATRRRGGGRIDVLAPEGNRLSRLGLMRVVREHTLSRVMGQEGLLLHSAGVVVGEKAVLLVGEKRSGKSSLMMHILGANRFQEGGEEYFPQVRYLANDRVWVSLGGRTPMARGFPTIASLRLSSLGFFPWVAERLQECSWLPTSTLQECRRKTASRALPWNGKKYTLSPIQLCRLLGVGPAAEAPLGAVVFPRVTGAHGRIRVTPMDPDEVGGALKAGLFRAGIAQKAGGFYSAPGFPRRVPDSELERRIQEMTRGTPCYFVELGREAFSDRNWVRRLQERMERNGLVT